MGQILSVDNLNVYYGAIHAIKGVSFEVNEGEVVTLIGANGAGKSTTLQTVSGLLHSRTGSIKFCGVLSLRRRVYCRRCGQNAPPHTHAVPAAARSGMHPLRQVRGHLPRQGHHHD